MPEKKNNVVLTEKEKNALEFITSPLFKTLLIIYAICSSYVIGEIIGRTLAVLIK